jgi:hypothetical protein
LVGASCCDVYESNVDCNPHSLNSHLIAKKTTCIFPVIARLCKETYLIKALDTYCHQVENFHRQKETRSFSSRPTHEQAAT